MKRLLLYLLCSVLLHAARPPDWLQLPAANDPRPAGASAWILHDAMRITQERPDELVFRHRHAVMPLSEIGVENAVCALEYTAGAESLVSAQAWAMSPDGKQCRAFGGRDFVIVSPTVSNWTWDLTKSVLFLAQRYLQPGWIFAWEVEIKSTATAFDIHWSPRNALPVRVASLDLLPMEEGVVKWKAFSKDLPAPMPGNAASALAWRIVDLPGYDRNVPTGIEPNSMELRAYLAASPTETKTWSDVVRLVRAEMDPKAILTPALDAEAHRLVGTGDFWSRIQPVCRFVQKEITYLSITIDSDSMAGFRPHPASEVWENRYGDCKDKAVLLCTMLGAIGIEARVMLVNSGAPMRNVIDWPSAVFNHAIVAVPCREAPPAGATTVQVGGRDYVVFDPTNEDVPFRTCAQLRHRRTGPRFGARSFRSGYDSPTSLADRDDFEQDQHNRRRRRVCRDRDIGGTLRGGGSRGDRPRRGCAPRGTDRRAGGAHSAAGAFDFRSDLGKHRRRAGAPLDVQGQFLRPIPRQADTGRNICRHGPAVGRAFRRAVGRGVGRLVQLHAWRHAARNPGERTGWLGVCRCAAGLVRENRRR